MNFNDLCSCTRSEPPVDRNDAGKAKLESSGNAGKESLCGVGISFRCDADKMVLMVDSLVNGGPANVAGVIQKNDVLVEVAGVDVRRTSVDEIGKLIIGPPRSTVKMVFERYHRDGQGKVLSGQRITSVLQRAHITSILQRVHVHQLKK